MTAVSEGVLTLSSGTYTARVGAQGAALHSLRHGERELVYRVPATVPAPQFAGLVLAPWPNRIANGRYRFAGELHQLPVNEVGRGNALHGLALWERWSVAASSGAAVTYEHTIWPRPGYPFTVDVLAEYVLGPDGLRLTLSATNTGETAAPVGLSAHPYLSVGGPLDDWTMQLPCDRVLLTDDRLLPRGVRDVTGAMDFRTPTRIGDTELDHAFTGVAFTGGRAEATLTSADGAGVRVGWDERCQWLQVYTMHAPGDPTHRRAVALEPMTCAPDAFNSGAGLIVLAPGETTTASMTIAGAGPAQ